MAASKLDWKTKERRIPESGVRFVAVSNRLPIVLQQTGDGWTSKAGSGGLVTALAPVLRNRGGVWIGWPGAGSIPNLTSLLDKASVETGYRLHPVNLNDAEVEGFYGGFSNSIIWPLFHDLVGRCDFSPEFWKAYSSVNRKFANTIATYSRAGDYIWVHDYHLICAAKELRNIGIEKKIGFFLHIPFPPLETFLKLPWRAQILRSFYEYDLVGFQTLRDRRNFVDCTEALLNEVKISGSGSVVNACDNNRNVRLGSFPISIDFEEFSKKANSLTVEKSAEKLKDGLKNQCIVLGVDRLDYTKGILERLKAVRDALSRYPDLCGNITYIQTVVPSREKVHEYKLLRAEIEQLVGEINGQFTRNAWVPIHYIYRSLSREELIAHYRAADIAIVAPLRDGMNLVAKEYCACKVKNDGVLILSEFAGAAAQLHRWALMVNPHNVECFSETIHMAFQMDASEKKNRMKRLRESIKRNNIYKWVDSFLQAAASKQLGDFPLLEDYVPPLEGEMQDRALPVKMA